MGVGTAHHGGRTQTMAVPGEKEEGEEEGNDSSGGPQPPHKGWGGGLSCMPRGCQAASHPVALRWHRYCHPPSPSRGQLHSTLSAPAPQCCHSAGSDVG